MFEQDFHITLMVAIDDADLDNGCLHVAEGGMQKQGLLKQNKDGSLDSELCETLDWKPVPCKRGDIILFDSYIPHFSHRNRSARSRRALYVTFNRASQGNRRQDYYQDKREKFPPECERDPNKDYSQYAGIYNLANPID